MRSIVDPEICIGCELCTQICPEVFEMHEDKAFAYMEPPPGDIEDRCREAAEQCPVDAITIET